MACFRVFARGAWRRLELPVGRVHGWGGRARFYVVRRGRLKQARSAAVLRGLRALQAGKPTTVREGLPLSQRRHRSTKRMVSPHCCCRRADDVRNALVQLNLTALQPTAAPAKSDAAVQTDVQSQSPEPSRKRALSPAPLPPAKLHKGDDDGATSLPSPPSPPPCKELIVNEEDVQALRRFLWRGGAALLGVDARRFDADDDYKSALFYRLNPLVCVERDARIPAMLKQTDDQSLLRAFAGSLGLRAVSELRARARYRMRPRARSSYKDNHTRPADASSNTSAKKSRHSHKPHRKSVRRADLSSDSSDSDSDFQTRSRNNKLKHDRNTRARFAQIRSKYEMSKEERDDDVRAKYLVTPRQLQDKDETSEKRNDRPKRLRKSDFRSSSDSRIDKETNSLSKENKRNDTDTEVNYKSREKLRNGTSKDDSTERSRSKDRGRNLRPRDESHSPSIISRKLKSTQRDEQAKDRSEDSDSPDLRDRNGRLRDRRGILLGNRSSNNRRSDRKDDEKDSSPSKSIHNSKDRKRNETLSKDRALFSSVDRSKNIRLNGESSKENVSKSVSASKESKETLSNSRSPSKTKNKTKIFKKVRSEIEDGDESGNPWASRNGTSKDKREDNEQSKDEEQKQDGGGTDRSRLRRSATSSQSLYPTLRREYSSLEDHAIVQWLSMGSRARRVNGNAVWRELQDQFARIAGRSRSWHSLRNRYLRSILPALGSLALPSARVTALRAAQAKGEIKSKRRAPVPNPLLALPPVRSAWGARPKPTRPTDDDTQDTLLPATSESEHTRTHRSLRSRTASPRKQTPRADSLPKQTPAKKGNASSSKRQPSPTYSEVTRRFGAGHSASTPELRPRVTAANDTKLQSTAPRDASPHKKTRKLYNPKTVM